MKKDLSMQVHIPLKGVENVVENRVMGLRQRGMGMGMGIHFPPFFPYLCFVTMLTGSHWCLAKIIWQPEGIQSSPTPDSYPIWKNLGLQPTTTTMPTALDGSTTPLCPGPHPSDPP